MDIQAIVNAMSAAARQSRSNYHLTLGALIESLEALPPDLPVVFAGTSCGPSEAYSYRGYYSDLAFAHDGEPTTVGKLLTLCRRSLNDTFTGYKGGEFVMGPDTPLWFSEYGEASGTALIGIQHDGEQAVILTKKVGDE